MTPANNIDGKRTLHGDILERTLPPRVNPADRRDDGDHHQNPPIHMKNNRLCSMVDTPCEMLAARQQITSARWPAVGSEASLGEKSSDADLGIAPSQDVDRKLSHNFASGVHEYKRALALRPRTTNV
jgi:hypothetical protein